MKTPYKTVVLYKYHPEIDTVSIVENCTLFMGKYTRAVWRGRDIGHEYEPVYHLFKPKDSYPINVAVKEGIMLNNYMWLRKRDDRRAKQIIDSFLAEKQIDAQILHIPYEAMKRTELGKEG